MLLPCTIFLFLPQFSGAFNSNVIFLLLSFSVWLHIWGAFQSIIFYKDTHDGLWISPQSWKVRQCLFLCNVLYSNDHSIYIVTAIFISYYLLLVKHSFRSSTYPWFESIRRKHIHSLFSQFIFLYVFPFNRLALSDIQLILLCP